MQVRLCDSMCDAGRYVDNIPRTYINEGMEIAKAGLALDSLIAYLCRDAGLQLVVISGGT